MKEIVYPPALNLGDAIAVVSTARYLTVEEVSPALDAIRQAGYRPLLGPHLFRRHHQWAGTDAERLHDLQWALDHPEVKAILCGRGGYGTSRLLDAIDFTGIVQHPKWLVGYSDITVLHAALLRRGIASIHGPMALSFAMRYEVTQESLDSVFAALAGRPPLLRSTPAPHPLLRLGRVSGRLIGGNLSLVAHLIGTPDAYDLDGVILVLEDLDEYRYHIDRLLVQLKRSGLFSRIAGLVIGSFVGLKDKPEFPFGSEVLDMLAHHLAPYDVVVGAGLPIGHDQFNHAFVHGGRYELVIDAEGTQLSHLSIDPL